MQRSRPMNKSRVQIPAVVFSSTGLGTGSSERRAPEKAFIFLLPALFLLISGPGLVARPGCWSPASRGAICNLQSGKKATSAVVVLVDVSTRRPVSRIGKQFQFGRGSPPLLDVISFPDLIGSTFLISFSPQRRGPDTLASRWQFDCRAAGVPRAPSFLS